MDDNNGTTQWEYKKVNWGSDDSMKKLNELGKQGWEVAGVAACPEGALLKRPVRPKVQNRQNNDYYYGR